MVDGPPSEPCEHYSAPASGRKSRFRIVVVVVVVLVVDSSPAEEERRSATRTTTIAVEEAPEHGLPL